MFDLISYTQYFMSVVAADILTDEMTRRKTLFFCLKLHFLWDANTLSSVQASSELKVVWTKYQ